MERFDITINNNSEDQTLTEEEEILLGVFLGLENLPIDPETDERIISPERKIALTKEGIISFDTQRLKDRDVHYPSLLESLVNKRYLLLDEEKYALSGNGRIIGKKRHSIWLNDFYNDILVRSANSKAHALFCEQVFGKNLCQYNVLDMDQLETMLNALNLQANDFVLDLGCGLGKISEYISFKTEARVLGIDFAKEVIQWAKENTDSQNGKLSFQVNNMNELNFPPATFNAIISIDTLYDWNGIDHNSIIKKLKGFLKPTGQMGIFYAQFRALEDSLDVLKAENTDVAKALTKNGIPFQSVDFTENGKKIWQRELSATSELREMFEKEGNLDLCEQRIADSKKVLNFIENQQERRYFYHVQLRI